MRSLLLSGINIEDHLHFIGHHIIEIARWNRLSMISLWVIMQIFFISSRTIRNNNQYVNRGNYKGH